VGYANGKRKLTAWDAKFVKERCSMGGFCPDLPCTELQQVFDHPEHGDHGERLANLKNWAKGDETILRLRPFPKKV